MPTTSTEYDAVVVGARVAGASTALMLARAGHRVALVDRNRFPSDTLSTHILWPAGVVQLQRLGLHDDVVASGAPAISALRSTIDASSLELPVPGSTHTGGVVHAPRRIVLDPILLAAAANAGVDVLDSTAVTGVQRGDDDRVTGIEARRRGGEPSSLRARLVVGADGSRSRIAAAVDAVEYDTVEPTNAGYYAYWSGLEHRGYELWNGTGGLMAGVVPTNDGACVFVNCHTSRVSELRADLDRGYERLLGEVAPDLARRLGAATRTSAIRGTNGVRAFKRVPWGPGWVLAGDAGSTKDPASAHGISAALDDAELVALEADSVLTGAADEATAFGRHHDERDRNGAELYELTAAMASYRWDASGLLALHARYSAALDRHAETLARRPAWAGASGTPRAAVAA